MLMASGLCSDIPFYLKEIIHVFCAALENLFRKSIELRISCIQLLLWFVMSHLDTLNASFCGLKYDVHDFQVVAG